MVNAGSGYVRLINIFNQKVMDVSPRIPTANITVNGQAIYQWKDNNTTNQHFKVEKVSGDNFKIIARLSGKSFDVINVSKSNGAAIQQWDYAGVKNQLWKFEEVSVSIPAFYEHGNYGGKKIELPVGKYNMADIIAKGMGNDMLSSLKISSGYEVILYEHCDFLGKTKVFTSDTAWVGNDFNDITSSIEVKLK